MPDLFMDIISGRLMDVAKLVKDSMKAGGDIDLKPLLKPLNRVRDIHGVAAVDGGLQEVRLSNGHVLALSRAIAVNDMGYEPVRVGDVRIYPESSIGGLLLMAKLEFEAALRALKSYDGVKAILMDGSLYVKLTNALHTLVKGIGIGDVYSSYEAYEVVELASRLFNEASKRGVSIIYVSKDSGLRIIKERAILSMLKDYGGLGEVVDVGLRSYSVLWVSKLRSMILKESLRARGRVRRLMELLLNQAVNDSVMLWEASRGLKEPHYTRPLTIGLRYDVRFRNLTVGDITRAASARLRSLNSIRGVKVEFSEDALLSLPKVTLTYVLPKAGDLPMLIEKPAEGGFLEEPAIVEGGFIEDDLGLIVGGYVDEARYNPLLALAHVYARFTEDQLMEYLTILGELLGVGLARRIGMIFL